MGFNNGYDSGYSDCEAENRKRWEREAVERYKAENPSSGGGSSGSGSTPPAPSMSGENDGIYFIGVKPSIYGQPLENTRPSDISVKGTNLAGLTIKVQKKTRDGDPSPESALTYSGEDILYNTSKTTAEVSAFSNAFTSLVSFDYPDMYISVIDTNGNTLATATILGFTE